MSDDTLDDTLTDFAVAAYVEDGRWEVVALPPAASTGIAAVLAALRQLPAEGGAVGLVSVADDFCVIARATGKGARLVLSDVTAAAEVPFASEVLDQLSASASADADADADSDSDDEDLETVRPVGHLDLLADLGVGALDLGAILDDIDSYPDEMLGTVAERLGFGEQFERAVETATR